MLNINRDIEDPFYRYKMPKLQAKIEGKGNGIKTVIANMVDIGTALARPPTYPTKYFGCELGAQTQFQVDAERYIVNGAHDASRLQDLLDGFIKRYVLCAACGNPETDLRVTSKKLIEQKCKACGHRATGIAPTHKLTTYIVNNPPEAAPRGDKKDRAAKRDKAEKLEKKEKEAALATGATGATASTLAPTAACRDNIRQRDLGVVDAPAAGAGGDDDDNDNDDAADDATTAGGAAAGASAATAAGAAAKKKKEKLSWSADTSDAAVRARAADLGAVATLTATDDLERPAGERLGLFEAFVDARLAAGAAGAALPARDIITEAERLDVKERGVLVLADRLWGASPADVVARIEKYRALFQRFTHENAKAQRNALHAVELAVSRTPALLARVAHMVKALYDADIVEDGAVLDWAAKPSSRFVAKDLAEAVIAKAAPVVAWLEQESDDEDEEEEDDEEEEEDGDDEKDGDKAGGDNEDDEESDVEDDAAPAAEPVAAAKPVAAAAAPAPAAAAEESDSDLDIDAI